LLDNQFGKRTLATHKISCNITMHQDESNQIRYKKAPLFNQLINGK
jgi:hypothetical protein